MPEATGRITLDLSELPALLAQLYSVVGRLEQIAPGRKFTLDGHLVGSIGEAVAAYSYGLVLKPPSTKGYDAVARDSRHVQIKLTQGKIVALSNDCEHLLVLRLDREQGFVEVYNGAGAPVWALIGHKAQPGRQRQISVAQLRALANQAGTPIPLLTPFPAILPKALVAAGAEFIEPNDGGAGETLRNQVAPS